MIKLTRPAKDPLLSTNEHLLTAEFECDTTRSKPVWDKDYIKTPLFRMTHEKCAYCETPSDCLEVDHFLCKSKHPHLVVDWDNLFPACEYCNKKAKKDIDCKKEPIIDPCNDNPAYHLVFRNMLYMPKIFGNVIARNTIKLLKLNNRPALSKTYGSIVDAVNEKLEMYTNEINNIDDKSRIDKMDFADRFIKFMKLAQPEHAYSAIYATSMVTNPDYEGLKSLLRKKKIWNSKKMQPLDDTINAIALK